MAEYKNVENIRNLFDEEFKKTRQLIQQGETHLDNLAEGFLEADRVLLRIPAADVVEVKHRNTEDESCAICNSELDEKYAGGLWDLAGEICDIICPECDHDEQDTVYNLIRNYIEAQNYCPNCGAKMDGKDGAKNG